MALDRHESSLGRDSPKCGTHAPAVHTLRQHAQNRSTAVKTGASSPPHPPTSLHPLLLGTLSGTGGLSTPLEALRPVLRAQVPSYSWGSRSFC